MSSQQNKGKWNKYNARERRRIMARVHKDPIDHSKELDITEVKGRLANVDRLQQMEAVAVYCYTGSMPKAAKAIGAKVHNIRDWKNQPWWNEAVNEVRKRMNDELDGRLSGVVDRLVAEIEDRINKGDEVVVAGGEKVRKKVSARELATTLSILFDKRALIRGDPTSRTERTSTDDHLEKLEKKFEDFTKRLTEKKINDSLPGELDEE
jgi:hypothetical protein